MTGTVTAAFGFISAREDSIFSPNFVTKILTSKQYFYSINTPKQPHDLSHLANKSV